METFATVKLVIENWRWAVAPYRDRVPGRVQASAPGDLRGDRAGRLQPDITMSMGMRVKKPGERMAGQDVELTFVRQAADDMRDAMQGSSELFARQDSIEAQWRVVDAVPGNVTPLYSYRPGSWGPEKAYQLIGKHGPLA
ncbi:MAG: hypothetical protein P4L43_13450 [Syntrophobacteraceae bacterium]|nr:hypothetical protein [Syntrophobacteraceae bacterium]